MRASWLQLNADPDYPWFQTENITWPYYDIRDPKLTPAYLDNVRAHPQLEGIGFYAVASWPEVAALPPAGFAAWTDHRLREIGWLGNAPIMFDVEFPSTPAKLVPYCMALMLAWRQLRPKRITDLTLEGHKGGLFAVPDAVALSGLVRWIVPQCYDGDCNPWDTWAICADLYSAGFPVGAVRPFYTAKQLDPWFGVPDGFVFIQGLEA